MSKTKCDFCNYAKYRDGKLSCGLHWFSLERFNKKYYCKKARTDLHAYEDFHRMNIQISPHIYIPKEHYEEYLAELKEKQEQAEKVCRNCRYFAKDKPHPDGVHCFCAQSTESMKQYVKPDDWCDRFTGASWVNKEQK